MEIERIGAFLESAGAAVIGTTDDNGVPHAGRVWGIVTLAESPLRIRCFVGTNDGITVANLRCPGARAAITHASVLSLQTVQVKGRVVSVEPPTDKDEARCRDARDRMIDDIHLSDRTPVELIERWSNHPITTVVVDIDESFDQTPGPSAGAPTQMTR